ncbi:carbon-nitrogen hydrolase family protein [Pusillimonas sp. TS35]|uniref:carbon-nitrogen hydrolase family protein n=1 Tax=Paracandidimonas lactea TaxID=2895524 RepID=UPI00137070A1|nr:carbon-nitrogen hydrolase family protein [Paracandidimonas lactea]MYN14759.1 carbon-nitrogen hydrolase family protein [Pusillimonas sp. TS35]
MSVNNPVPDFRVAAIQMVSSSSVKDNLAQAAELIAAAVADGARILALPEYFCFMGHRDADKLAIRETSGSGLIQAFLADQARRHSIWLVGGTLPLESPDADRIYNSCLVYDPAGAQVARYDKIHLFGFRKGNEAYDESISIRPGDNAPTIFDSPCGKVGLSICYDLRFPELFRAQGEVSLIVLPSAFTYTTGSAHWEILLRARAIENQCYVLAPAQGGRHENGRRTWGHSMLVDPWGDIVEQIAEGPGYAAGNIAPGRLEAVRTALPALRHRTL